MFKDTQEKRETQASQNPGLRTPSHHFSQVPGGSRNSRQREPGEGLPARVWNPFARPAVFSQGEVGGPGLPPPRHHLFPVYLFILKSHPATLLGAPNIPASLQRGAKGTERLSDPVGSGLTGSYPSTALPAMKKPDSHCNVQQLYRCSEGVAKVPKNVHHTVKLVVDGWTENRIFKTKLRCTKPMSSRWTQ